MWLLVYGLTIAKEQLVSHVLPFLNLEKRNFLFSFHSQDKNQFNVVYSYYLIAFDELRGFGEMGVVQQNWGHVVTESTEPIRSPGFKQQKPTGYSRGQREQLIGKISRITESIECERTMPENRAVSEV